MRLESAGLTLARRCFRGALSNYIIIVNETTTKQKSFIDWRCWCERRLCKHIAPTNLRRQEFLSRAIFYVALPPFPNSNTSASNYSFIHFNWFLSLSLWRTPPHCGATCCDPKSFELLLFLFSRLKSDDIYHNFIIVPSDFHFAIVKQLPAFHLNVQFTCD